MCGRFTLFADIEDVAASLGIYVPEFTASYNIAPSQQILSVVGSKEGWKAGFLRWGLIPSWAKDRKIGYKMINARSETLDQKPAFKRLLSRRRCLIVADSFYEWKREGKEKRPHRITVNGGVFTFAGLWDRWQSEEEEIPSCTIITCAPNELMADIHDRMPVILDEGNRQAWLDTSIDDKEQLKSILVPYPADKMAAHEVTKAVGNPRNNGPELIEQI